MAGSVQPILFPVPWAYDASISHLMPPEEIRSLLRDTGFAEVAWVDVTAEAITWFRALTARTPAGGGPPPLGLHLVVDNFAERGRNQLHNMLENRVVAIQSVQLRPGG